jgi:hypothetical protein
MGAAWAATRRRTCSLVPASVGRPVFRPNESGRLFWYARGSSTRTGSIESPTRTYLVGEQVFLLLDRQGVAEALCRVTAEVLADQGAMLHVRLVEDCKPHPGFIALSRGTQLYVPKNAVWGYTEV